MLSTNVYGAEPYCTKYFCSDDMSFCSRTTGGWCSSYGQKFKSTYNGVTYQYCMPENGHVLTATSDTLIVCFKTADECGESLWGSTNSQNHGQRSAKYECAGLESMAIRTAYFWRCGPGYYYSGTGWYKETTGTMPASFSGCTACPTGTANPDAGADSPDDCKKCTGLYYSDATGLENCKSCPSAPTNATKISYTGIASTTINNCKWTCNAGYYGSSDNGDTSCANCGAGYYCTGGTNRTQCPSSVNGTPTNSQTSSCGGRCNNSQYSAAGNDPCHDCPASNISGYTPMVGAGASSITGCFIYDSTGIINMADTYGNYQCTDERVFYKE